MTATKTKMTRDEFWAAVAEMGWGTKTTDTKTLKRTLMRKGQEFCKEFKRNYQEVDQALLDAGCDLHGGDGVGDCRSHIIGLGKDEYDAVMADLSLGEARYERGDYKEKFSYCFPYDSDWEDVDPSGTRLVRWAKRNIKGLRAAKKRLAKLAVLPQVENILTDIAKALELHRPLLQEPPDFQAFAESGGVLKDVAGQIEDSYTKLRRLFEGDPRDDVSNPLDNKWGICNLVSDTEEVQKFWDGE
jgi:hypothetical protein